MPDGESRLAGLRSIPLEFDHNLVWSYVRRVALVDDDVFSELRDDDRVTLTALVLPALLLLLSSLGTWLFLELNFGFPVDTGALLTRHIIAGTITGYAMWLAWVLVAEGVLVRAFDVAVDRPALARTMGFASVPLVLMVVAFLPDIVQDTSDPALPSLSFALGLVALFAWFALSDLAITAAVPAATRRQVLLANLAGFLVFAGVLTVLASREGIAPGVWVHTSGFSQFIGF